MISANRIFKRAFTRGDHGYMFLRRGLSKIQEDVEAAYSTEMCKLLDAKPKPKKWKKRKADPDEMRQSKLLFDVLHYNKHGILLTAHEERELRAKYASQVNWVVAVRDAIASQRKRLTGQMTAVLPQVLVVVGGPEQCVAVSDAYTYRSQTQPDFYAENYFRPLQVKLTELGCTTRVVKEPLFPGHEIENYCLYADIPRYMAHAVNMRITDAERCKLWKQVAANPLVYNPFLPYELASF